MSLDFKPGAFNDFFDHEAERRRIFECSLYWEKLEPYRRLFGDDKILCLTFEDMIADPAASLRTILGFLGVDMRAPAVDRLLDGGQFVHANAGGFHDADAGQACAGFGLNDAAHRLTQLFE